MFAGFPLPLPPPPRPVCTTWYFNKTKTPTVNACVPASTNGRFVTLRDDREKKNEWKMKSTKRQPMIDVLKGVV